MLGKRPISREAFNGVLCSLGFFLNQAVVATRHLLMCRQTLASATAPLPLLGGPAVMNFRYPFLGRGRGLFFGILMSISLLAITLPSNAQTTGAGTITGTITDASQAVVPGVSVTVTNV